MENLEKNLLNAKISMEEVEEATKKFEVVTIDNFLFENEENIIYIFSHWCNVKNCLYVSFSRCGGSLNGISFLGVYFNKKYYLDLDLVNIYNETKQKINETFFKSHENCKYLKQKNEFLKTGYYDSNKWSIEDLKIHLIYNYIYKNKFNDDINVEDFILRDAIKILKNKDNYINSNLEFLNEDFKEYEAKSEEEKKYIFKGWHVPYSIKILNCCFEQNLRNKLIEEIKSDEKINKIKYFVDFINNLDKKIKNIKVAFVDGREEQKNINEIDRFDFLEKEINNIKAIKHGKKTLKEF